MSNILERFREYIRGTQFNAMRIGLASPKKIRSLSYGEVKKIETINYRTLKPERDGLFCARIFGPVKDWECNCGKYKRMKHRGVTCEKCGVEVIQSRVRRERMGHVELVAPVCHIWYLKGIPSYLSLVMDLSVKDLERVIYFDMHMVVHQGKSPYPRKTLLTNAEYDQYTETHLEDTEFVAESGAEAVRMVLALMDLNLEIAKLEQEYQKVSSVAARHKIMRRIKVLTGLSHGNLNPDWMILEVLPVLPPDLRPLVPLEGGRFASSDLNELYRRVLNRNIRLQRLKEIEAPQVIIKNEKRMLQEATDSLIDNGRRGQPVRGSNNKRPLKSLSEMLRGKQGRFRQNLLGKRVDYSGRSVIVVDPELQLNQCGLPKLMALELFKPYIYAGLIERELASNLRLAKRMVEEGAPEVWDVLEDVVQDRPVLLNRAPTLHRLGIQAFFPILVDGKAIKVHPLVCGAFNADFDGDTMSVHIPLSSKAQKESKALILPTNNILSPANGKPVPVPSQDMVLGLHYMSKIKCNVKGEGITFSSTQEVVTAFAYDQVDLHAKIKVRLTDGSIVDTGTGRVLLFNALPEGSNCKWSNKVLAKNDIVQVVEKIYYQFGNQATVDCLDRIKKLGFYYATMGGISFSMDDLLVPAKKDELIIKAEKAVQKIEKMYMDGVITNGERYNKVISIWNHATADIANEMAKGLEAQNQVTYENKGKNSHFNPIFMMLESGARGSKDQIKQLVGMRGLMATPAGDIMETPVKTNFKDGLSVFEYFISTHGARKGQADTALKTANSGYLTRRLVDVAQDVVINLEDCKTLGYIEIEALRENTEILSSLANRAYGRVLAADIKDPITGQLLFKQGEIIHKSDLQKLENSAVVKVFVRSPLTCMAKRGICAKCYGTDLSRGELVEIGITVGIIAAQSIGEPGTQLTMRTFHTGGTASSIGEQSYYTARTDGILQWHGIRTVKSNDGNYVVLSRKGRVVILSEDGRELQRNVVEYGSTIYVDHDAKIKKGTKFAEWDITNNVILTEKAGRIQYIDLLDNITIQERYDEATKKSTKIVLDHKNEKYQPALSIQDEEGNELAQYYLPTGSYIVVENEQVVNVGDILVKMPREASKTRDITTGGLPRIAELF